MPCAREYYVFERPTHVRVHCDMRVDVDDDVERMVMSMLLSLASTHRVGSGWPADVRVPPLFRTDVIMIAPSDARLGVGGTHNDRRTCCARCFATQNRTRRALSLPSNTLIIAYQRKAHVGEKSASAAMSISICVYLPPCPARRCARCVAVVPHHSAAKCH